MLCSLKFHYLILYVIKVFSLSFSAFPVNNFLSLQFFFLSTLLTFFHYLRSFIYHFLCNPCLSWSPLYFPNQSNHSIYHKSIDIVPLHFHIHNFTSDPNKLPSAKFSSVCRRAYKLSTFHLGFPFWKFVIFFNLKHIFASSQLLSQ
jgi:hypothetical protein